MYAEFAVREARGVSPTLERLSLAISVDEKILALLETVPAPKRQPNLVLSVVRFLGGSLDDPAAFRHFTVAHWPDVEAELRMRATQTNEVGRSALLLPVLASLPHPLALLEVGAAAGLGLYPDRYAYRYGGHEIGSSGPVLDCALTGTAPPTRLPEVVWRAGLDLNPLDVTDPADIAWLRALIWPEHHHRRDRLRDAAAIAAANPPMLTRGDLVDDLLSLAAQAPVEATLVVFPHIRAVSGPCGTSRGVRGTRPLTARALGFGRGPRRCVLSGTAGAAGSGVVQRACARRNAAGLDSQPRAGDDMVRVSAGVQPSWPGQDSASPLRMRRVLSASSGPRRAPARSVRPRGSRRPRSPRR